jgi:mono/diheme cytochrome c family protein
MPLAAQDASAPSPSERGKALYEQHCAVCHGKDGHADTPVARLLNPPPRVFADPIEMGRVSVDRMYRAIKEGRPGTAMAAWAQVLTETEIGDVIDYVHGLDTPQGTEPLSAERLSFEIGRRLYERNCASCHGARGHADTEFARLLNPKPRSFADPIRVARLDDGRMYLAIFRGRPGTAMGGWGSLLSPAEIIDLMRFIRTLAEPLPAGTTPAQLDVRVGEQVYQTYCVPCHGAEGNGQTPLGQQLTPHPRDFTATQLMASRDDKQLTESVMHGVPGTAMAPWDGVLNKEDVRRVILFIRERFSAH